MKAQGDSLRNQVALGWVLQLLTVTVMIELMIVSSVFAEDNFRDLLADPGRMGLKMLTWLFAAYALMPVFVHLVHGLKVRFFRWLSVAFAGVGFTYFLLHHLSHWLGGQRSDVTSHVLDVTLHLISLWVIVNSVRWARSFGNEAE